MARYKITNKLTGEIIETTNEEAFFEELRHIRDLSYTIAFPEGLDSEPARVVSFLPFRIFIQEYNDIEEDSDELRAWAEIDGPDAWAWAFEKGGF